MISNPEKASRFESNVPSPAHGSFVAANPMWNRRFRVAAPQDDTLRILIQAVSIQGDSV
jgi:hypothetical protein